MQKHRRHSNSATHLQIPDDKAKQVNRGIDHWPNRIR